jgi:hypothetical protein
MIFVWKNLFNEIKICYGDPWLPSKPPYEKTFSWHAKHPLLVFYSWLIAHKFHNEKMFRFRSSNTIGPDIITKI